MDARSGLSKVSCEILWEMVIFLRKRGAIGRGELVESMVDPIGVGQLQHTYER